MPIATKLSRKLQEVFGTEAGDAMVDWMRDLEGGRAELRDLNDLSFARFDSRLGERIAELDAKLDLATARLDAKIDGVESRLDAKIDAVESRLDAKIDRVAAELNAKIDAVEARLSAQIAVASAQTEATLARHRAELFRWAAMFWIGSLVTMAGTMAAVVRLSR
ncbi:MAG TPA: hypothetical protein VGM67_06425 [Gemmatimonadaceae bacterium]|jgi:hypothetical protein